MQSHVNVGTGEDVTIKELAYSLKEIIGYSGEIVFDINKMDGAPKALNTNLLKQLGWKAKTNLMSGLRISYKDFLKNN